ncbi:MAG: glutathione S-transferase family protein [Pseudomonadota bacterium]|nr:glutathione S-transferase family protein [Pseudomonadota bacterium]
MYKLYYSPGACSMAVHVILNELGVQFEAVNANKPGTKDRSPEFLKINPRGAVPVLDDDGQVIREGAAIIIHLLEQHPSAMLPTSGRERDTALEWLMFANATVHPGYSKMFFIMKNVQDKAVQEQLYKAGAAQIEKYWQEIDERLAKMPYICGKDITAADILLTVFANWNSYFPVPIRMGDNVKRLLKEISSRPSYQKALKTEQVEYKAAA